MSSNIDIYAKRAQAHLNGKNPDVEDVFWVPTPGQIALFASIFTQLIKAIKKCTEDQEEALRVMHRPNRFQRGMLKRITRRKVGWWKYYTKDYVGAVEQTGKDVTREDLGDIWNEEMS